MPDTKFTNPTLRYDPYKNFKFRLKWDGKYVAGASQVSKFTGTSQVIKHRDGADPSAVRSLPGQNKFEAITLQRGVTHDTGFQAWANKVWSHENATLDTEGGTSKDAVSMKDFRKDITLEVFNEAGQPVQSYTIFRCWVSEYEALPGLDAEGNAVAIQQIKLENEGWELDVQEPTEHSAKLPTA